MKDMALKLYGKATSGSETCRSYFLVADGAVLHGRGRASAVPMSRDAPMPPTHYIEVNEGGEMAAMQRLIGRLLDLPDNSGLTAVMDKTPS